MKNFIKLSTFILILIAFTEYSFAQAGRGKGRIGGVVVDETGNPIPSAKIVVQFQKNTEVKQETTTNKKGEWSIIGLGTGMWKVTASAEGYIPSYTDIYARQLERNPKVTLALKKAVQSEGVIIEDEASLQTLEKGNQLFKEKQFDEARAVYEQFLEQNPNAYQAHLSIGDCYREKGEFEKALEEYNEVFESAKEDELMKKEIMAKALARIGECYLKKEDFEKAQEYFKKSIETYPENEILAYNVGEIYFSNQKIDEAIEYFSLASKIKPDWSEPYLKLGYVYLNKADNASAIENFEKFLKLEPDSERSDTVKNILDYLNKKRAPSLSGESP